MLYLVYSNIQNWEDGWQARTHEWLTSPERARLDQFGSSARRCQFLAARLLLRQSLANIFSCEPIDIELDPMAPVCAYHVTGRRLGFVSISHSGPWIAVAIGSHPIGVDCERTGGKRKWRKICRQYFAQEEAEWLLRLPREIAETKFLQSWTVKEALAKSAGLALGTILGEAKLINGMAHWPAQFSQYRAWCTQDFEGLQLSLVSKCKAPAFRPHGHYIPMPCNPLDAAPIPLVPLSE
ncbi:4'-phosphopantetheinyl transferase family protein [Microbulbifer sp. 2201CG32-9]|uniref:4'-phosphopantetheinyl transferase family protein n=1 Tax=Microbulbifer sp. 2201CG32-9 TaxID=3232309 RepID=UPI00345BF185